MTVGSYGIKNFSKARGVAAASSDCPGGVCPGTELWRFEKGTEARVLIQADSDAVQAMLNRERNLAVHGGAILRMTRIPR